MRKKNVIKMCTIIISIWIVFMVGKGFYWYYKFDGENVSIIISSQYSQTPVDIKVYIDDQLIYKNENFLSFYHTVDTTLPFGIYNLKTIVDNEEYVHTFILFPIKFIYIEASKEQVQNDKGEEVNVIIDISSSPINMM